MILVTSEERTICFALKLEFPTMNNEVEYEALIVGLKLAKDLGVKALHIYSDSQLMVCQVKNEFQAKRV